MKFSNSTLTTVVLLALGSATAVHGFVVPTPSSSSGAMRQQQQQHQQQQQQQQQPLQMFSGGGDGAMKEDASPEQLKALQDAAKAMGMTVEEYQLGINARMKFETAIGELRYSAGDDDIGLEVDGRAPPTHLVVKISEAGKAKGQDAISAGLAAAFKKTSADARGGRQAAQNEMMKFIQEAMK
jgi:hypothetical protein